MNFFTREFDMEYVIVLQSVKDLFTCIFLIPVFRYWLHIYFYISCLSTVIKFVLRITAFATALYSTALSSTSTSRPLHVKIKKTFLLSCIRRIIVLPPFMYQQNQSPLHIQHNSIIPVSILSSLEGFYSCHNSVGAILEGLYNSRV